MSTVIVIRGNSGSGKTTIANKVHSVLGSGTLLISQDYVRRTMLNVRDRPNNLAIGLIENMLRYGIENCEYIIVEGILAENKYGEMLRKVLQDAAKVNAYYYDLSFEETVKRHQTKMNVDFDQDRMKDWFTAKDLLHIENEKSISGEVSEDEMIRLILADLGVNN